MLLSTIICSRHTFGSDDHSERVGEEEHEDDGGKEGECGEHDLFSTVAFADDTVDEETDDTTGCGTVRKSGLPIGLEEESGGVG